MMAMNKWTPMFDDVRLPSGIDKRTLVDDIILKCGEFEVLYSEPAFLKGAIKHFFDKNYRTFDKWIKALNIEYSPLENYDRREEWTDETDESQTSSTNSTNNIVGSGVSENLVSAYDSSAYSPHDKTSDSNTQDSKSTTGNTFKGDRDSKHTGRTHGNIGVTTSQQMLQAELDIARWNVYDHISDLFVAEFCLMID